MPKSRIAGPLGLLAVLTLGIAASSGARSGPPAAPVAAVNAEPAAVTAGTGRRCPPGGAADFDHYFLGREFEGLALVAVDRRCEPPPREIRAADGTIVLEKPVRANDVAYIYGDCSTDGAATCLPPLQVIAAPGCERPHSLYERYAGPPGVGPTPHRDVTVRGVKAAVFDDGTRVELYTHDATVTVTGADKERVMRALDALVAAPGSPGGQHARGARLPPPRPGVASEHAPEVGPGRQAEAAAAC